jgi:endonuclease/exonuclease/phosphatase family metal-dependent hydrolase
MTWNLGYGGMGAEDDFFLDGGHNVLAKDKESVLRHLESFTTFLQAHPADVDLLEEVDSGSRRSYFVDQKSPITAGMQSTCSSYALNHNVYFIPYPKLRPLGKVRSGMLALGKLRPTDATRYQLRGKFPWPDRAFQMERCLLVWELPREDGKNWTIVQLHLEAWDAGHIRTAELEQLRELALQEYAKGNFVVLGGDWNAVLPGVPMDKFTKRKPSSHVIKLDEGFLPAGWTWGVDRSRPSNRSDDFPYDPGKNYLTVIDGFVVSPNVRIDLVETIGLNFQDTDHEPVRIEVTSR